MKVQIINKSRFNLPEYATPMSAGVDLRGDFHRIKLVNKKPEKFFYDAFVSEFNENDYPSEIKIMPHGRCLIPTGIFIALPEGYEAQCRMRSGLALKLGLSLDNGIGTIDADYRGEIGLIIVNTSNQPVIIKDGERLGQLVLAKYEVFEWEQVEELPDTIRGNNGYGHSGTK